MTTPSHTQEHVAGPYSASQELQVPPSRTKGSLSPHLTFQMPVLFPLQNKTRRSWDSLFPQRPLSPNPALPPDPSLHPQLLFVTAQLPKTTQHHLPTHCLPRHPSKPLWPPLGAPREPAPPPLGAPPLRAPRPPHSSAPPRGVPPASPLGAPSRPSPSRLEDAIAAQSASPATNPQAASESLESLQTKPPALPVSAPRMLHGPRLLPLGPLPPPSPTPTSTSTQFPPHLVARRLRGC